MNFVISDTHCWHNNILRYCSRNFPTVEAMNTAIYDGLSVLPKGSTLYHLGDFSFGGLDKVKDAYREYIGRLAKQQINKVVFHQGNHDKYLLEVINDTEFNWFRRQVEFVQYSRVNYNKNQFILFHYPIENWDGKHHGSFMLHGHGHSDMLTSLGLNRLDCGVDIIGYQPLTLDQIVEHIKIRNNNARSAVLDEMVKINQETGQYDQLGNNNAVN